MGCVVLILCGLLFPAFLLAWSCRVAGIFGVAGYDAGTVVVSPRRGFFVGGLRVYPTVDAGGELLYEVCFFPLQNIPDWDSV